MQKFSKGFKLTIANAGISRLGTSAFDLMILWIVLEVTHSAFLAGLGEGLLSLPLFFSFILGALIDKMSHKKLMALVAGLVRAGSLAAVILSLLVGSAFALIASIYLSALVIGFTSDIMNSVRATWTKEFLSEAQYKSGSSISSSISTLFDAAGYTLSGLILSIDYLNAFLILIAIFLVATAPLLLINEGKTLEVPFSPLESMKEGLAFIRGHKAIAEAMIAAVIINLVFGMSGVMFAALVQIRFKLPAYYMSILIISVMAGALIGSAGASKIRGRLGYIASSSVAVAGASSLAMGFSSSALIDVLPALIMGIAVGVLTVAMTTAFLKIVPYDMMARVQGGFNTFTLAVTFASGALGGALVALIGARGSFMFVGVFVLISSVLWLGFKDLSSLEI
ncbi:MAG: MFS transporter [Thermoprotei archaeon]